MISSNRHKPRVLVLTSTFPRWRGDTVPCFVERLVSLLATTFRITVVAPHFAGAKRVERWNNVTVVRYRYFFPEHLQLLAYGGGMLPNVRQRPWLIFQVPFLLIAGAAMCRLLHRRFSFSLVHAHWIVPQMAQVRLGFLGTRKRPKVLVTAHGSDLWSFKASWRAWIARWAARGADMATVVSNAMTEPFRKLADRPIFAIPMGTETDRFRPPQTPPPLEQILFVGRLSRQKGAHVAIRVVDYLRANTEVRLTIAGDGPERAQLASLVEELDLTERVTFTGWVERSMLPDLMRCHGIFLFTSTGAEGFGLTIVEAMASGCTVVASALPAVTELVEDGATGKLCPPGDPISFASTVRQLLENPDEARIFSKNARTLVCTRFSSEQTAVRYARLYEGLLTNTEKRHENASR